MGFFSFLFGQSDRGARNTGESEATAASGEYAFKWYEVGPENPFNIHVLNVRPLTWNVVATTSQKAIAESYNALRASDGRELVDRRISDAITLPAKLKFPHNGAPLEGIVFKADSMDVKWDIYIYNGVFLFARSWTGDLKYRAKAEIQSDAIVISEVECSKDQTETAVDDVFFLLASHALKRVLPHRLPSSCPKTPMDMATLSFSLFGNRGCYATFEDITSIPISTPPK